MEQTVTNPEEQVIFISHGDCEKDAQYVADQIRAKWNVKEIVLNEIGPGHRYPIPAPARWRCSFGQQALTASYRQKPRYCSEIRRYRVDF